MKNILFRADSSSDIGIGHIMRDLVLASRYPDDCIIFASQDLSGNINSKIVQSGYILETLNSNNIEELNNIIIKRNIDMIVIDNYDIDYEFEKKLKNTHKNLVLMSLDDTYQRHNCDILLNHNISADKNKYKDLVPKNCDIRCGKEYSLIRDEFIEEKYTLSVLLIMGGADSANLNIKILEILSKFDKLRIKVLSTKANKNIEKLKEYIKNNPSTKLLIDSEKIAKLMKNSDFIICTPSMTLNEVYYMGVPFIAIKTADNQDDIYNFLKENGYFALSEFDEKKLRQILKQVIANAKNKIN